MSIDTVHELFLHDLNSIYYLERQLEENLDDMAEEVTNENLQEALMDHWDETSDHVQRLEQVYDHLGEEPEEHKASDFEGYIEEAQHLNEDITETEMLNLAFLNAAIKVERMEITTYESLLKMADRLEMNEEVQNLLKRNLDSEKDALDELQVIAEGSWFGKLIRKLKP